MADVIPTLTLDGFVSNKKAQMVKLFEYFLASDKSQSNVFNNVQSLKYILTKHKNNGDIKLELDKALQELYGTHFTSVTPDVRIIDVPNTSTINIYINVKCTYEDKTYELVREVSSTNGDYSIYDKSLAAVLEEQGII